MEEVSFIDLFAGMGGIRLGFQNGFKENNLKTNCVLTSEIKKHAITALKHNFKDDNFVGDITLLNEKEVDDFDFLLAGFPCQTFSSAGNRDGFCDTRGTMFFHIERLLKEKSPFGFLLENVEGLIRHDLANKNNEIGRTLKTILASLEKLGYNVSWKLIDSKDFGLAQSRKRVYIVGTKGNKINLNLLKKKKTILFKDIKETGIKTIDSNFTRKLLSCYDITELHGKAIKDKRGGINNIHSWEFGLKGKISKSQILLLEQLFKERRRKCWAEEIGIDWMDGMPLTLSQIETFFDNKNLKNMLIDLVKKGYIKYEFPKSKVRIKQDDGSYLIRREYNENKNKGYNIVTGKLSFEFSKILDDNDLTPTLVASDVEKLGVIDGEGIRKLTLREGLRLLGYPESYSLDIFENTNSDRRKAFDLLGNTVAVPVIQQISELLAKNYKKRINYVK